MTKRMIIGLTGASGSIYALTLIKVLAAMDWQVELIMSPTGEKVLAHETGVERAALPENVHIHENTNLFSSLASGSYRTPRDGGDPLYDEHTWLNGDWHRRSPFGASGTGCFERASPARCCPA